MLDNAVFAEFVSHWKSNGYCPQSQDVAKKLKRAPATVYQALVRLQGCGRMRRFSRGLYVPIIKEEPKCKAAKKRSTSPAR